MRQQKDMEIQVISAVKHFASTLNSGAKVVADMSSLIDATSQLPLANFDYWERLIRDEFPKALKDANQPKWTFWSQPLQILTWLDLISWDGYKREKALRTISGAAPNAFFFSLAIRRLNDWVPQVRAAAREALPLITQKTDSRHVVDALCIALSSWNSWGRIKEADKQVLIEIISRKDIVESFKHKLISSTAGPMSSLLTQLGRTPILDKYLGEISEKAVQPSLRAKAYRCQFEGRIVWIEGRQWKWTNIRYCEGRLKAVVSERKLEIATPFLELLRKSAIDGSAVVRRVAAEFLIRDLEKLGEKALPYAEKFASDASNPVSERGIFALKRLESINKGKT